MMTREQKDIVLTTYLRFIESEEETWTSLDTNLEMFEMLTDTEVVIEASVKMLGQETGTIRCYQNHKQEYCFAPTIQEAVHAIIELWDETKELHYKNRYILLYYIAMSELKLIFAQ